MSELSKTIESIRKDFPLISGSNIAYLDNAATTQKPQAVLDAVNKYYQEMNANPFRGVYELSEIATESYENARKAVAQFIGAKDASQIVFTRNATESLNLIAYSYGMNFIKEGDEIVVSVMEHHSNFLPWKQVAEKCGAVLKQLTPDENGEITDKSLEVITDKTRLVAVTQVSNVLGRVNDIKHIAEVAHAHGAVIVADGAQSVPHMKVDMQEIGADFFAFSGHKVYGPTGIGVLYGKEEWLDKLPPYQGGGEMIQNVSFEKTTFNVLPYKFEAGTPDYIGSTALAKALDYVSEIGIENISAYEAGLTEYAMKRLYEIPDMRIFGEAAHKGGVISFLVGNIHHLDMGTLLDRLGIAVRTGHHCAEPLMRRFGIEGTVRASLGMYNTKEEIDSLVEGIDRVRKMF